MKIGIICAMKEEFELIKGNIQNQTKVNKAHLGFIEGKLCEKNVVGVVCGIGKVNASVCTQILISEFKCTHILNTGVAGGIKPGVKFKDIVIATDLIQHDVDVTKFGHKPGEIPYIGTHSFKCDENLLTLAESICNDIVKKYSSFNVHIGRIITGDQFIADNTISNNLHKTFNALACEMESGSIAQTCYLNEIPFLIIRAISDNGGDIAGDEFYKFLRDAASNSYLILRSIISCL